MSYIPGLFEDGRPVKKNKDMPGPRPRPKVRKRVSERELQEWDFDHPANLEYLRGDQ